MGYKLEKPAPEGTSFQIFNTSVPQKDGTTFFTSAINDDVRRRRERVRELTLL